MIKISVILPIYNGADTLANTLDSLLAQTFSDFELIACLDGSTDSSESILTEYSSQFKKLTILKNSINRGLGPTMNRLVANTSGQYIAVAEQDDYYYPNRFKLQVEVLDRDPSIGLVSGIAEFWDGNCVKAHFPGLLAKGKVYPKGVEMFMLNYKHQIKVVNSCMMFRKSVHIDNGLYFTQHYPSVSVDWTYILRLSLLSNIYGIHEILVRLDRRSIRKSITSNRQNKFLATHELLRCFKYEYPDLITAKDYRYAKTTQHLMEISNHKWYIFPFSLLWFLIQNPMDQRWKANIYKRVFKKKTNL